MNNPLITEVIDKLGNIERRLDVLSRSNELPDKMRRINDMREDVNRLQIEVGKQTEKVERRIKSLNSTYASRIEKLERTIANLEKSDDDSGGGIFGGLL